MDKAPDPKDALNKALEENQTIINYLKRQIQELMVERREILDALAEYEDNFWDDI